MYLNLNENLGGLGRNRTTDTRMFNPPVNVRFSPNAARDPADQKAAASRARPRDGRSRFP